MNTSVPLLETREVFKSFGASRVLGGVSFDVQPGEVLALVGENGAGKSTLMNIVGGVVRPDKGAILWEGRPIRLEGPRDAQTLGISFVHQELALVPQLNVAENIYLNRHPARLGFANFTRMHAGALEVLRRLGCDIDTHRPVAALSLAEQQTVEIARAVAFGSRLIIMDEPTAPLGERDAQLLMQLIRVLCTQGVSVIFISHRLHEIFEIADRVTVLRDGKRILTRVPSQITATELVRAMTGSELEESIASSSASSTQQAEVLRVEGSISLAVRRGEIVGLAGLAGAGRTELLESLFGVRKTGSIRVFLNDQPLKLRTPIDAIRNGIALVPDDRKLKGLVLTASVLANIAIAGNRRRIFIRRSEEHGSVQRCLTSLGIKSTGSDQSVIHLSGGNQQKVVLAKWLYAGASVFLLDEPMRGIDVRAKSEICEMIRGLAKNGAAILMASSETEELMGLADRIIVMHRGRISGELPRALATEERIMHFATGAAS